MKAISFLRRGKLMKILLTTHGKFASGVLDSYRMIFGNEKNIVAVELSDNGVKDFRDKLKETLDSYIKEEDILIICDLKGGTPYNESYRYLIENQENTTKVKLVTGLNLPMLIEVGARMMTPTSLDELEQVAVNAAIEGIQSTIIEEISNEEINNDIF